MQNPLRLRTNTSQGFSRNCDAPQSLSRYASLVLYLRVDVRLTFRMKVLHFYGVACIPMGIYCIVLIGDGIASVLEVLIFLCNNRVECLFLITVWATAGLLLILEFFCPSPREWSSPASFSERCSDPRPGTVSTIPVHLLISSTLW
ncbi:hypothetical protein EDB87DRAFT_1588323 [Lactarius vividus]|nr:hypothetical protein EDB87DRAFT_1588323 [Lactarius vividus]